VLSDTDRTCPVEAHLPVVRVNHVVNGLVHPGSPTLYQVRFGNHALQRQWALGSDRLESQTGSGGVLEVLSGEVAWGMGPKRRPHQGAEPLGVIERSKPDGEVGRGAPQVPGPVTGALVGSDAPRSALHRRDQVVGAH
jgi:hypothetical protein